MNFKPINAAYAALLNLNETIVVQLKRGANYRVNLVKNSTDGSTAGNIVSYTLNKIPIEQALDLVKGLLATTNNTRVNSVLEVVAATIGRSNSSKVASGHSYTAAGRYFVETKCTMRVLPITGRIVYDIELVVADGRLASDAYDVYEKTSLNIPRHATPNKMPMERIAINA